jgi:ubiquinone/menaquinone biosynthesis C-methylase UbiE
MSIFFSSYKEQKKYIWTKLNKIYPQFKTGGYFVREYLKNYINKNSIIVDAGCGKTGIISEFKEIPKSIIGIDINKVSLEKNRIVDKKIMANLENIPLDENSTDIVMSEFVLEHLQNPDLVFKEVARILKPGGVFIFITPNIVNPIIALSKILPYNVHRFMKAKLLKRDETHRTYYRANTFRKLLRLGKSAGFQGCEISRAGNPEYFGFCKPLIPVSIFFEKLIDNNFFNIFKMYLIGFVRK